MRDKREFNFAQRWQEEIEKAAQQSTKKYSKQIAVGLGGALFLGAIAGTPWVWSYKLDQEVQEINAKIGTMKDIEKLVRERDKLKGQVAEQERNLLYIENSSNTPLPVLDKLSDLLPVGTSMKGFTSGLEKTLIVVFVVPEPVDAARLWTSLEDSGLFEKVDIQTISLEDEEQELTLSLQLKSKSKQ